MELQTITQVSKGFNISTRTLRYYEQIGILSSMKKDEYAYRVYDEKAINRLRQIILLRKLRVPLKQIAEILGNQDAVAAIKMFEQNVNELNDEITALSTIRSILSRLIGELTKNVDIRVSLELLNDDSVLTAINALSLTKIHFKEEKSMDDLNKANEQLSKLTDVRIVYLPPMTVAASQYAGNEPEAYTGLEIDKFVRESNLCAVKPDLRLFGFNSPDPVDESMYHGYEFWVTIPEDMDVPAPLVKKHFPGGQYAVHMIQMGNFHEWEWLFNWVKNNNKYEYNGETSKGPDNSHGTFEEHLNYITHINKDGRETHIPQLDLMIPVKEKQKKD